MMTFLLLNCSEAKKYFINSYDCDDAVIIQNMTTDLEPIEMNSSIPLEYESQKVQLIQEVSAEQVTLHELKVFIFMYLLVKPIFQLQKELVFVSSF